MGERGPKPTIIQALEPVKRAELDEAIIDGRHTKAELFERFGQELGGIGYRAFCNYAAQLEARAKHRYVGELLTNVFGNLPDADIDTRAKGLMMAMMDRLAGDVLSEGGDLKPRDLRDLVQSYDLIRRGAIVEAQEKRDLLEWDVHRMAGVAEAAAWMKQALAAEIGSDPEMLARLEAAVDRCCQGQDKPAETRVSEQILKQLSKRRNWKREIWAAVEMVFGIRPPEDAPAGPRKTEDQVRQEVRDLFPMAQQSASPTREEVYSEVDNFMMGKDEAADSELPTRGQVVDELDTFMRGKQDPA